MHAQEEAPSTHKLTYAYDTLGRIQKRELYNNEGAPLLRSEYAFVTGGQGTGSTTPLVEKITQAGRTLTYTYDIVGNITSVHEEGSKTLTPEDLALTCKEEPVDYAKVKEQAELQPILVERKAVTAQMTPARTRYSYDKLGQLTRVDDQRAGETWIYDYNQGGNILWKACYAYTLEEPFTYHNYIKGSDYRYSGFPYGGSYNDCLTSYNGIPIAYDAIANPTSYDGWTFEWKAGRMLDRMQKASTDIRFTYDHTGLRVKKSFNGEDTLYTLNGKKITHVRKQVNGENVVRMHFFYDAQGRPSIIRYNDVDYVYVHNLQGDVIAIVDMDGNKVVEYGYDAWGKPTGKTGALAGTLGTENPFRYRGYVWDEETGLYYLRSRYYDPEWGRFLNQDTVLGKPGKLLDHNLFSYCRQNPVIGGDPSGMYDPDERAYQQQYPKTGQVAVSYQSRTTSKGVFLRESPSKKSKSLGQLPPGTFVNYGAAFYDKNEPNEKLQYWLQTPDGWINARHIVNRDECTVCEASYVSEALNVVRVTPPTMLEVEHSHGS